MNLNKPDCALLVNVSYCNCYELILQLEESKVEFSSKGIKYIQLNKKIQPFVI